MSTKIVKQISHHNYYRNCGTVVVYLRVEKSWYEKKCTVGIIRSKTWAGRSPEPMPVRGMSRASGGMARDSAHLHAFLGERYRAPRLAFDLPLDRLERCVVAFLFSQMVSF